MSLNLRPRKFSVDEYARMGDAGIFRPEERVELIEGEIVPMSPHNRRHALRIAKLNSLLVLAFAQSHDVRVQLPLTLGSHSEPEPDFALVPLDRSEEGERHPGGADLVIEVSDSSLPFDRNEKASLYAKAGIAEYWLLNLRTRRLEVRLLPGPSSEAVYGWDYAQLTLMAPGQLVAARFAPDTQFEVARLLGDE